MTVTIQFSADIEAGLLAQAQAEGVDVPRYVENLVRGQLQARAAVDSTRPAQELTSKQRLENFQAWVKGHEGNTVVLPAEAMERESIYGDHGR
jgi:hypothetical protein